MKPFRMKDYTGLPGTLANDLTFGSIDIFDALEAAPRAVVNAQALWQYRNSNKSRKKFRKKLLTTAI